MPSGNTEARIRRLMMDLQATAIDAATMKERAGRLEQDLAGFMQVGANFGGYPSTIAGNVTGCGAGNLPGMNVTVKFGGTSSVLGTGTTDASGNYSIPIMIPTDPCTVDITVDCGTGYVRYTAQTGAGNTANANATTTVDFTMSVATGYACHSNWVYPLATTLTCVDSSFGTQSMPFGTNWAANFGTVVVPAGGTCAGGSTPLHESLLTSATTLDWTYHASGPGLCPATGAIDEDVNSVAGWLTITSNPTLTTKLDMTYAIPAGSTVSNFFYGGAAATVRVYEP